MLETFCEGGLLGCGLLLSALSYAGWKMRQLRRNLNSATLAAFVLLLVASQFSGDMYDSRGVFLVLLFVVIGNRSEHAEKAPASSPSSAAARPQLALRPVA